MSSGSSVMILFMAFVASTLAASSPFSYSNSAVTTETSSLETELTFRTRSMVCNSSSIFREIWFAMSLAEAPGSMVTTAI